MSLFRPLPLNIYGLSILVDPPPLEHLLTTGTTFSVEDVKGFVQQEPNLSAMTYSSSDLYEPEFFDYDPTPYYTAGTNRLPLPLLDAICYSHPAPDPNEGFFYDTITPPYGKEEVDFTSRPQNASILTLEAYEGEQLPYYSSGNWLGECDFGARWGDDFFSRGFSTNDDGYGSGLEGNQSEEHWDSDYEDVDDQPACDYNPWFGYGSWFGNGGEEDSYGHNTQERKPTYNYGPDETGLCESIFGHWPCLFQKDQESSGEQEANEQRDGNLWKGTADYLFGSSFLW